MSLSKEAIEEFKAIYKKRFGEDLSDDIALEKATRLLRLAEIVYKPMTESEYEALQKRRKETKDT